MITQLEAPTDTECRMPHHLVCSTQKDGLGNLEKQHRRTKVCKKTQARRDKEAKKKRDGTKGQPFKIGTKS
jgi:hypothetical protein